MLYKKIQKNLLQRVKPDFKNIRKILIIRQDRIGDVILTLPLATQIKKHFPHIKIFFLVKEYTSALCLHHRHVDETWILPADTDEDGWSALLQKVKDEKFDMAIVPNSKKQIAALVFKAKISIRMSAGLRLHSWKYNLLIMQSRKKPVKNELDYNLDLLRDYMPVPAREKIDFNLSFSPNAENQVQQFLTLNQIQTYCIVHPGSGGSAVDLPLQTLAEFIGKYDFGMPVIITGSEKERSLYLLLKEKSGRELIDATGIFSLEELTALISGCSLFISNSTGPIHIANAFGRKLLGFYSTFRACHPLRWGPYLREKENTLIPPGEKYETMEPSKNQSRLNMQQITADDIVKKISCLS